MGALYSLYRFTRRTREDSATAAYERLMTFLLLGAKEDSLHAIETITRHFPHLLVKTNAFGWTPVHLACFHRTKSSIIFALLLNRSPNKVMGLQDNHGWTPLHLACYNGASSDILGRLVDKYPRALCTTNNQGETPLSIACRHMDAETMEYLVNQAIRPHVLTQRQFQRDILQQLHSLSRNRNTNTTTTKTKTYLQLVGGMDRMNLSGRSYFQVHPTNKPRGVCVLESTIDNVDCLCVHLRENPLLCCC
jgi:ankyrin repeat protein